MTIQVTKKPVINKLKDEKKHELQIISLLQQPTISSASSHAQDITVMNSIEMAGKKLLKPQACN
jgi:hypothetical protein